MEHILRKSEKRRYWQMKGYNTGDGYMGFVDGRYMLFASEADYYEYMNDGTE